MEFIDLLFLGISFFVGYRLYLVLGSREGYQASAETDETRPQRQAPLITPQKDTAYALPNFNEEEFLAGARIAFERIIKGFVEGNAKELSALLGSPLKEAFLKAITHRTEKKERHELSFFRLAKATLTSLQVDKGHALAIVDFTSEQTQLVFDANDTVIEGDPNTIDTINEQWTFKRSLKARTPNWKLVATKPV